MTLNTSSFLLSALKQPLRLKIRVQSKRSLYLNVLPPGYKPSIINYSPKRYGGSGYDGKVSKIPPHAIQKAVKWALETQDRYYRNDKALGRGEDDDSYWGNGCALPIYQANIRDVADTGYFITLVTEYLQKQ